MLTKPEPALSGSRCEGAGLTCDGSQVGGGRGFALAVNKAAVSDAVSHGGRDPVLPPPEPVFIVTLSTGQNLHFLHNAPVQPGPQNQRNQLWTGRGSVSELAWCLRTCRSSLDRVLIWFLSPLTWSHSRTWTNLRRPVSGPVLDHLIVSPSLRGVSGSMSGFWTLAGPGFVSGCLGLDGRVISDLGDDGFLVPVRCCLLHVHVVYIRTGNRTGSGL